ncbi:TPA: hypothetical protein OL683_000735 [Citrobacter freundii]|nr:MULTISPECIES: DUF6056 family protein [Citrobacter]KAA3572390.1 hypothetical protein D1173_00010 [Citrobacter freundii]MDM3256623.1 DUF6056 family protein [Citrobacter sp. Cf077]HAT3776086.1 hypothetical protein [Citrobacter freundii]HAU4284418.1 hypothetical protein [Citrobacter freundii]HCA5738568.1 hypothetical protein [Citrobacter freundii]
MSRNIYCLLAFIMVFLLVLIPALHTPMLSDDYYYTSIANLQEQFAHYREWSGRIITNMFSSYMMHYTPHALYETLTALALAATIFFISSIPNALFKNEIKPHPLSIIGLFALYWIANPSLGETTFWFVGAANYLWTTFYISLFMLTVVMQKPRISWWKVPFAFFLGFAAGCSNENTSIVTLLLTIIFIIYKKNISDFYPYLIGLVVGIGVLLLGPGTANRSVYFTDWHNLTLLGKVELQLFTRMPDSMSIFWQVYIVIIILSFLVGLHGASSKKQITLSSVFFVSAILCNAAFIASPFMPPRAYSGALFMLLLSVSFLLNSVLNNKKTIVEYSGLSIVSMFTLLYFIPSYYIMTNAIIGTWNQESIRLSMIHEQVSRGIKEITIPDLYMQKLIKPTDAYPAYKHPARNDFFHVNSINEEQVGFDYSSMDKQKTFAINSSIYKGITLDTVYFYSESLSGSEKIVLKITGEINKELSDGKAIYIHLIMNDGKFINKDTSRKAMFIGDGYYTYSNAEDINFSKVKKIELGMYDAKTGAPFSKLVISM